MRTIRLGSDGPPWTGAIEGDGLGSGVSVILNRFDRAGEEVKLHRHPYSETFLLRSGKVSFTDGVSTLVADAGQIIVVPPNTPHAFTSLSADVEMIDIHASDHFITDWL
jgi:quercetin dioxygenase-like cupin family protein